MIEIHNEKGKKIPIRKSDIKEVKKHFDVKKPSIRCKILLNDGKRVYSCMSYKELIKLLNPIN